MLDIARFCQTFPGLHPFAGWPQTDDGAIPCRLFFTLYRAIPHMSAGRALEGARATGTAISTTLGGDRNAARDLSREAYPELETDG